MKGVRAPLTASSRLLTDPPPVKAWWSKPQRTWLHVCPWAPGWSYKLSGRTWMAGKHLSMVLPLLSFSVHCMPYLGILCLRTSVSPISIAVPKTRVYPYVVCSLVWHRMLICSAPCSLHRTALLVFCPLKPAVSSDRSIPAWQGPKCEIFKHFKHVTCWVNFEWI